MPSGRRGIKGAVSSSVGVIAGALVAGAIAFFPSRASAQQPPPPSEGQPAYAQKVEVHVHPDERQNGPRYLTDWNEGEPIPVGYHPVTRARKGLVVGGATTFGTLYLLSVLTAAIANDASATIDINGRSTGRTNPDTALFVPAIGPFIQMGKTTDSSTGQVFLAIDGIGQCAGLFMLFYGLAVPKTVLVRDDLGATKPLLRPTILTGGRTGTGLGLVGTF